VLESCYHFDGPCQLKRVTQELKTDIIAATSKNMAAFPARSLMCCVNPYVCHYLLLYFFDCCGSL